MMKLGVIETYFCICAHVVVHLSTLADLFFSVNTLCTAFQHLMVFA